MSDNDEIPVGVFDQLEDAPPSPETATDGTTCPECDREFDTVGGMRRHRTRIHKIKSTDDAKPRSVASGVRKTNIERELVQWFTFIGMTVSMFNQFDGMIIVQRAEPLGHAWANLCRQNKAVEKVIQSLLQTSAVGEVLMATSSVIIPIMANHEMLPSNLAQMFGGQMPPEANE